MRKWLAFLVFSCAVCAFADKVVLLDGSVVKGKIMHQLDGKVTIKNDTLGTLNIKVEAIESVETDEPMVVADQDKQKTTGVITSSKDDEGKIKIGQDFFMPITSVFAMWPQGERDLTLPKPRKWNLEIYGNLLGKSGNTNKFNGGIGGTAKMIGPNDRLIIEGSAAYDRENGKTSTERYFGSIDYETNLVDPDTSWYIKLESEKNKIDGLDLRLQAASGLGYKFINLEDTELRLRGGIDYQSKWFKHDDDYKDVGYEINVHFEHKFTGDYKISSDFTYNPSMEALNNYRWVHESFLECPMAFAIPLSLRVGIRNEYESKAPKGVKKLDTIYFARLVLQLK